jgi:hypothetical protein
MGFSATPTAGQNNKKNVTIIIFPAARGLTSSCVYVYIYVYLSASSRTHKHTRRGGYIIRAATLTQKRNHDRARARTLFPSLCLTNSTINYDRLPFLLSFVIFISRGVREQMFCGCQSAARASPSRKLLIFKRVGFVSL